MYGNSLTHATTGPACRRAPGNGILQWYGLLGHLNLHQSTCVLEVSPPPHPTLEVKSKLG